MLNAQNGVRIKSWAGPNVGSGLVKNICKVGSSDGLTYFRTYLHLFGDKCAKYQLCKNFFGFPYAMQKPRPDPRATRQTLTDNIFYML
jgi:hypothetical protein